MFERRKLITQCAPQIGKKTDDRQLDPFYSPVEKSIITAKMKKNIKTKVAAKHVQLLIVPTQPQTET